MNNIEQIERIPGLLVGYLRGDLTEAEKKELYEWVNASEANRRFFQEVTDESTLLERLKDFLQYDADAALEKARLEIKNESQERKAGTKISMKRLAIAACLLVIAAAGIYFIWIKKPAQEVIANNQPVVNDVMAGTEKATLTLSDGRQISIDSASNGVITEQGQTVGKNQDGSLIYASPDRTANAERLYHTLTTPRGGEYRSLVLSDGSKVWLNSVSSIRYPVSFEDHERKVEISGEVYFEVAPDKSRPFRVVSGDMQVEVLGTHFNINTYDDNGAGIQTTLLEGSVKVSNVGKEKILKPGQQAVVTGINAPEISNDIDTDAVIAWKNGSFVYDGASIKTIMRDISRWYDVDVVFDEEPTGRFVLMGVQRSVPLSKLLGAMEKIGGVHFEVDGKTVRVKK